MKSHIKHKEIKAERYIVSGQSVIAITKEHVKLLSNINALVDGYSSIGRVGSFIQNEGSTYRGSETKWV